MGNVVALFVLFAVVILDQVSKVLIVKSFALYESMEILPGFFSLTYLTNKGAAFGFLANIDAAWRHYFFLVLAVVALVVLFAAYRKLCREHRFYGPVLALIAGGAIGNVIDRIRLGAVVDFLDFYVASHHWPAFNVADSAITVGVTLFIVINFFQDRSTTKS